MSVFFRMLEYYLPYLYMKNIKIIYILQAVTCFEAAGAIVTHMLYVNMKITSVRGRMAAKSRGWKSWFSCFLPKVLLICKKEIDRCVRSVRVLFQC